MRQHNLVCGRTIILFLVPLVLVACSNGGPGERYGFVARLGRDTLSVDRVTRRGNTLVSDEVDRFPRVRRRHTEVVVAPDGGVQHLTMDIETPSDPASTRERHVVAEITHDSVRVTRTDGTGTHHVTFASSGVPVMAHVPQMYSLYELYFAAALQHADQVKLAPGDSVHLHQFYVDREFDNFPLHDAFVRPLPDGKAEIWHAWLAGIGEGTLDKSHHLLAYSGAGTTYKVDVVRIADPPDVEAIGNRFAATEAANGGAKQLSVRDTARGTIGKATFSVDYGRPLARGRVLLGGVIPYDEVWRTGANAATQLTTSVSIKLAGLSVPAGTYTLWTIPQRAGTQLIVNKQVGQWGTEYHSSMDLGRVPLATEELAAPVEEFTIGVVSKDASHGTLVMEWGQFRWTAPIVVR
jgi:hypothetical protein